MYELRGKREARFREPLRLGLGGAVEVAAAQGRGEAEDERVRGGLGVRWMLSVGGCVGVRGLAAAAPSRGRGGCDDDEGAGVLGVVRGC